MPEPMDRRDLVAIRAWGSIGPVRKSSSLLKSSNKAPSLDLVASGAAGPDPMQMMMQGFQSMQHMFLRRAIPAEPAGALCAEEVHEPTAEHAGTQRCTAGSCRASAGIAASRAAAEAWKNREKNDKKPDADENNTKDPDGSSKKAAAKPKSKAQAKIKAKAKAKGMCKAKAKAKASAKAKAKTKAKAAPKSKGAKTIPDWDNECE